MNSRRSFLALVSLCALCVGLSASPGVQDEKDQKEELKERFAERYPTFVKLKDAGKVGETPEGETQVVKPEYAKEKLDPEDPKSLTVAEFLALENKDRKALYVLLAQDKKETPAAVAKQNALRNYKKAEPLHFLLVKRKDGKLAWVQKKDLEKQ